MANCLNCGTELVGRDKKKYCSRSCSATKNNSLFPKRKAKEKPPKKEKNLNSTSRVCIHCGITKNLDEFYWRNIQKKIRYSSCRECVMEYNRNYYATKRIPGFIAYYIAFKKKKVAERRSEIWKYFSSHPCVDCGESDPVVLDFDHRNRSSKIDTISNMILGNRPWPMILAEIEKCDVRCANCHRRRTAIQLNYYTTKAQSSNQV